MLRTVLGDHYTALANASSVMGTRKTLGTPRLREIPSDVGNGTHSRMACTWDIPLSERQKGIAVNTIPAQRAVRERRGRNGEDGEADEGETVA